MSFLKVKSKEKESRALSWSRSPSSCGHGDRGLETRLEAEFPYSRDPTVHGCLRASSWCPEFDTVRIVELLSLTLLVPVNWRQTMGLDCLRPNTTASDCTPVHWIHQTTPEHRETSNRLWILQPEKKPRWKFIKKKNRRRVWWCRGAMT